MNILFTILFLPLFFFTPVGSNVMAIGGIAIIIVGFVTGIVVGVKIYWIE